MHRRYLFGPVSPAFAQQCLKGPRERKECIAFGLTKGLDLLIRPNETWEAISVRFPSGWQPDFIVLYLPYTTVPSALLTAPVPLVALAPDWYLLWHYYRRRLRCCDLVLTDTLGKEKLTQEEWTHVEAANLSGVPLGALQAAPTDAARDIDVLLAGNLNSAIHREQLQLLSRLAQLRRRWRVLIQPAGIDDSYRRLLRRARIVVNSSHHGECNPQALEAAAAGALLFQEAGNREVPDCLRDREECVLYRPADLESLLEHYLGQEDERRRLAAAAQDRLRQYTFESIWDRLLQTIEARWPAITERSRQRAAEDHRDALLTRCWESLNAPQSADLGLVHELQVFLKEHPNTAGMQTALGLALAMTACNRRQMTSEAAADQFRQALTRNPSDIVAGLNLAEALTLANHRLPAIDQARRTLGMLTDQIELSPAVRESGHFPPDFGTFRVEWEQAAWTNAGDPSAEDHAKRQLLRWRLHALLGELTGDMAHHYEAYLARPDLPASMSALGCALARDGRPVEALGHLRAAVGANPMDHEAARALYHTLGAAGDAAGQHLLARDRRLFSEAAPQVVPAESWFAENTASAHELTSILILCHNQLPYTRLCLESLFRHTRLPYELVLIDNGSTDDTPSYLQEIRSRPGPLGVEVIRNETNRGYPAGCNQALARARGRFLVFLNNDTILTEGWLEGLIAHADKPGAKVGMVGPVSNGAPPPQEVPGKYKDDEGLQTFARQRRQQFAAQSLPTTRVTGFCLLVRREVFDRVGLLDERFGIGFFDDDDLCIRAREAGFGLVIAQDVFIHHFGNRTFKGLGLDVRRLLLKNFEVFKAKWGPERVAGYRLPEPPPEPAVLVAEPSPTTAPAARLPRVSLSMIVRNEEKNLADCLRSAADLVDEVVIVDTGSTDRTKEIAAQFGAKVFDFPWVDSFAAARNESLRHATGAWVWWLDADDRIDEENRAKLRELFARLGDENVAYVLKIRSATGKDTKSARVLDQVRLFRNHPYIRWRYRVHEQILPAVGQWGGQSRWTDIVIDHTGYQDETFRQRKLQRNLRLLELEVKEQPDDAFTLFNLGRSYLDLGRTAEALPIFQRSLERSGRNLSIVRKLYALLTQAHWQLKQSGDALAICKEGLTRFPDDAELLFQQSLLLREKKDWAGTEASLQRLLDSKPGEYFDLVDAGMRTYKAQQQLAEVYQQQGRKQEAETAWRAALQSRPDWMPALRGLAEIYLEQKRWGELDEMVRQMNNQSPNSADVALLQGRVHLAKDEYPAARKTFEELIRKIPDAIQPRVLLTHALIREAKDWPAAEQALREVLARDPKHAETRHNLAVLLRQQGRGDEQGPTTATEPTIRV